MNVVTCLMLEMEIVDKDFKSGFISAFQNAVKVVSYYPAYKLHLQSIEAICFKVNQRMEGAR